MSLIVKGTFQKKRGIIVSIVLQAYYCITTDTNVNLLMILLTKKVKKG